MNSQKLRLIIPLLVGVLAAIGFSIGLGTGTLSAFGWGDIALLCPLGALSTMISSGTIIPRAIVSIVIAALLIIMFGRAFCGWICPVPVTQKLRNAFRKSGHDARSKEDEAFIGPVRSCDNEGRLDSRHIVLAGSLLSAVIFGFPVFCLICPIGLSFATIFLVVLLFGGGDITWSILIAPALLLVEVLLFRKWCSRICPLSAFMSLIAKFNRTFVPTIDSKACIKAQGGTCDACSKACEMGISLHDSKVGTPQNECLKCRACVDSCPAKAINLPLLPRK